MNKKVKRVLCDKEEERAKKRMQKAFQVVMGDEERKPT
jgi:hypothetical protein